MVPEKRNPNIVYIMGRGHSGTTLLNAVLGNADPIESVGELLSGMNRLEEMCSCGKTVNECSFWSNVRNASLKDLENMTWEACARISLHYGHIFRLPAIMFRWIPPHLLRAYVRVTRSIFRAISDVSGKQFVVDSSKEFTRAMFLASRFPEARIIHLVRNGEQVLASRYWRLKNREGFRILRKQVPASRFLGLYLVLDSINWVLGNLVGEAIRYVTSTRVLRVKYEDFCEYPEEVLTRISRFLKVDLSSIIEKLGRGEGFAFGHTIAGNRIRFQSEIVLNPHHPMREVPKRYGLMFRIIAAPLIWLYGY
ncbi:MAG: sulfotransferase [Candidatus Neomarinimicrobiota bacterium]